MADITSYQMLINGEWVDASDGGTFESVNPSDGKVWSRVPEATEADVNSAVEAAHAAFTKGPWASMTPTQRGKTLRKLGDLLADHSELLGRTESIDTGKMLKETRWQATYIAEFFHFFAGCADKVSGETLPIDKPDMFVFTKREPLGVVAAVVPWNSQLFLVAVKIGPALAAGNTVVLKASEHASAAMLEFGKLRDKAGILQAFANTCRHRAMRLMEGSGNCRGIRCPFHAWAYRLDGTLVAAPQMDQVAGFEKAENGLIPYRAEERLGFVFICLNADAPPLDDALGDFAKIHAPWPLETLVSTRTEVIEVACNWKAFLEVFNEYYHLPFVHPNSIGDLYDQPDAPEDVTGAYVTQFGATEGTGGLLQDEQAMALPAMPGLSGQEAAGVRYTWVFPNMTFAAGTEALWVYAAYPLGANRCKVVQTACFPPETLAFDGADAKVAAYHTRLDAALAEDIPALETQHQGLSHPDAQQGRFQPLLEPNVAGFARWYADKMIETL